MNTLLLFFALPVATIILAIVLEKIIRNPYLTAATFFAIYLVITFAFFDETFLVYAIVYTILAFITVLIAEFFYKRSDEQSSNNEENLTCGCTNRIEDNTQANQQLLNNRTLDKQSFRCYRR